MMKFLWFLLIPLGSLASVGDYFGSSASTLGLGGQANFDATDPSNNQYAGSLLLASDKTSYSFNIFSIDTNFKKIKNIVVNSPINSAEIEEKYGDIDTHYSPQYLYALHGSFKLFQKLPSKLNLSVFFPVKKMLETSTGDPYRPEYVMYHSRFARTIFFANMAYKFSSFSMSLGGMSGFQSNGETYIVARETSAGNPPSSGKMSFNASPSMALTFSITKDFLWGKAYFSLQDEMKSELTNTASGYTPIGASSLKYDWDLSSLLFYDPRIYRFGFNINHSHFEYIATVEYQDWSGYKAPLLDMKNNGGILLGSNNQENFHIRNIIVPKLATIFSFKDHTFSTGLSYRPTPLDFIEGASGNSLDTDATIISLGYKKNMNFLSQEFNFNTGLQYHQLKTTTIRKDPNRENGDSGFKIGAPKYQAGGSVLVVSLGLSWLI